MQEGGKLGTPESWPGTLAGVGLFLLSGLALSLGEIPRQWIVPSWIDTLEGFWFLSLIALPPLGYGIGWIRNFPRWSYPYTGLALLVAVYMVNVSTPGLRLFGYTFGSNDLWGWRAWIPFLVMTGLALLVTRSFQPVVGFFRNGFGDWSGFAFGLFGFMPLLIMVGFDEIDRLYSLYFMHLLTVLMAGTALAYLRVAGTRSQRIGLVAGILASVFVVQIGSGAYWIARGGATLSQTVLAMLIVLVVMFAPALLAPLWR